ncbi:TauD/TfdA family dioxygenase [Sphingomicrobium clamense]|uniref:TauD/TfdA family dioxygenase n=1 Tax=Sphingomicrobium clamense TaxID=2851013 RepID=A0ABS6V5L5_9SPHN|nr:TauD/TfdA family dioxygenase [Sphingomicrobium sp. B8]MBW0144852.1 TauD/TfdA family dioxygenase [Sphingomicrobium sp. B8]
MFTAHPPTDERPAHVFEGDRAPLASIDHDAVMAAFEEDGAVLIRGADFTVDDFRDFAQHFCPLSVFNESPDRLELEEHGAVQSVNLGADAFPLHPELSREPWRPDACFFACLEPPAAQGQTTYCDGIAIADALPADIRAAMEGRQLLYIQPATSETLKYWLGSALATPQLLSEQPTDGPYTFRAVGNRVVRYFTRPILSPTRFGDGLAFANFLLFARDYLELPNFPCLDDGKPVPAHWMEAVREAAEKNTRQVEWLKGDILMLDNSRFMHGRRAITDPDNRMIATYFGYLEDADPMPGEPDRPVWRQESFKPPSIPRKDNVSV